MEMPGAIFCWSVRTGGGFCLHKVLSENTFRVRYLLTTLNANFNRVSMHGVREQLMDEQIAAIGIPALKVWVKEGGNSEYETEMERALLQAKAEGIEHVIFGDIFLEDLRAYRENNLAKIGMKAVFPLWKKNTGMLITDFIEKGFKTVTCCVNDGYLGEEWVGKEIDREFVDHLPKNVDPCGENGEYHTFCYDGPIFKTPIKFSIGEKIYKPLEIKTSSATCKTTSEIITRGFWFCDLVKR